MAIDVSFRLFDNSLLTVASDPNWAVSANVSHTEGDQDRQYWFGSNAISSQLQAASSPGTDPLTITPTYILPTRQPSTVYTLGTSVIPATPNGYRYVVSTAGTSSSGTPTWGVTLGGTTTDGTVVWTLVAVQSNVNEIKIADSQANLDSATGGAPFSLGNTVLSGVSNAVTFWVRTTNAIEVVSSSIGQAEFGLTLNAKLETPQ